MPDAFRHAAAHFIVRQLATAQFVVQHFVEGCALEWRNQPKDVCENASTRG
jgi:hypothetical protein